MMGLSPTGWLCRLHLTMTKYKTDLTWGIDRNPNSPEFGNLVVGGKGMMPITLWDRPAASMRGIHVTGGLKHNQRVEIISRTTFKGCRFVKVRKIVIHKGKKYPQVGWLTASLLKREGKGQEMYG